MTNATFQECLKAVMSDVFPPKSLLNQKPFMRCFLRKSADMLAKDYIAQVCTKSIATWRFSPTKAGRQATKLPTDKLLGILEFGVPLKLHRSIHLHRFKPQGGSIKDFENFCKCLEPSLEDTKLKNNKKNRSSNNNNDRKKAETTISTERKHVAAKTASRTKTNLSTVSYTEKNTTYNSDQYHTLQQDAEKCKEERMINSSKSQHASKQELHTIVEFSRKAMESAKTGNKKEEELNNFDSISIYTTGMST